MGKGKEKKNQNQTTKQQETIVLKCFKEFCNVLLKDNNFQQIRKDHWDINLMMMEIGIIF